ncbi:MAG: TonB-dependent hemoglobin/transferrin/lactoferrin family receptor [Xanthomonadales bacterium]|nr:TonB-dependent hemoglobin/transferrin/lactoferrin family receptor [Xanthomonadales bacterium]MBP7624047.1 TonB-dependent hemoglobin/transferrin/lactoferrin family receptor [Xanthomonadales bacterium]
MRRHPLSSAIALSLLPLAVFAADAETSRPTSLDAIVVVASRVEQPIGDIAGSVALIERGQIETRLIRDIRDLARYDATLSVNEDASRFGTQGFAIRGLEGNRVAVELDGVPLGDGFAVGSFSRAGRNLVDPELLQRVEFLRGPASSLYGSDALAGVVAMRTRDPADLLAEGAGEWFVGSRLTHDTRDASTAISASSAVVSGGWQMLVSANERREHERDTMPRAGGIDANPADGEERFLLAKLVNEGMLPGRLSLGLDAYRADTDTDVRSLVNGPGQYATTTAMNAQDAESRGRASLAWSGDGLEGAFAQWNLMAYVQRSEVDQRTVQDRRGATASAAPTRRLRQFVFDTQQVGLEGLIAGEAVQGELTHRFVAGFDLARTAIDEHRDGVEINLNTGASTPVLLGERMPVRDFPNSTLQEFGLYVQDDIEFGERWFLIPALRYDRFRTDADPDALWLADNPAADVVDSRAQSVTPKLGLRYAASDSLSVFAQYARGFRAPPFSDVNLGLNIPAFGYSAIPNPDLRPERSQGLELGARWSGQHASGEVSIYDNRYRDLIESRVNLGRDPQSGLLVFQSQNRDRARIHGIELNGEANLAGMGLDAFNATLSVSWVQGEDTQRELPLNSVDPARLVLGLNRDSADGRHRVELLGRFAAAKDDVDTSRGPLFAPAGYGVFDLFWHYAPTAALRIDAGISNLGDRRYWQWSSVRGFAPDAREVDLATQSGRAFMLSLRVGG